MYPLLIPLWTRSWDASADHGKLEESREGDYDFTASDLNSGISCEFKSMSDYLNARIVTDLRTTVKSRLMNAFPFPIHPALNLCVLDKDESEECFLICDADECDHLGRL